MAPKKPALGQRIPFRGGPFKGVNIDRDPYNDPPDKLLNARNMYFANVQSTVGAYLRPGFIPLFGSAPLVTSATAFRGQQAYSHAMLDGTTINFIVMGGKLFRVSADLGSATDVTPVGVTIDAAITTRVFMVSLIGQLVVTDGVNRPWVATNLTSTPVTGTYIDYDGHGVSWTAFGAPALYGNAIFFILNQVNGISRRTDVSFLEPGFVDVGLQQDTFDNNITLETSSTGVLYAIKGTNLALYYFRASSIGSLSGVVGIDLASSKTEDAVSFNVGSQACQTLQEFGNSFYFCDAIGRPWKFTPGVPPEPIWYQLRGVVETSTIANPLTTAIVATSVIEPTLNKYLVGIYSPNPVTQAPVVQLHEFDAVTGTYEGHWTIGPGIGIDCIGSFTDSSGRVTIIALGSLLAAPATTGYAWTFNSLASVPLLKLTTEDGLVLTTEDGRPLTTEGLTAVWQDNGQTIDAFVTTGRFGYDSDTILNVDQATVIALTDSPIQVSVMTSAMEDTVQGIPEPSLSQDGTYRLVCGFETFGRGAQVTVRPLDTTEQWALESVSIVAVASRAGVEDA